MDINDEMNDDGHAQEEESMGNVQAPSVDVKRRMTHAEANLVCGAIKENEEIKKRFPLLAVTVEDLSADQSYVNIRSHSGSEMSIKELVLPVAETALGRKIGKYEMNVSLLKKPPGLER